MSEGRNELIVIAILGIVDVMAVWFGYNELATNISSGLIGFIGGKAVVSRS